MLLSDRLAPITSDFGFIEAEADALASWFGTRESALLAGRGGSAVSTRVAGELEAMLLRLLPLTVVERRRNLFVPTTKAGWTAMFGSGWQGGDPSDLWFAAEQLQCHAVRVSAVTSARVGKRVSRYGARMFELYGPRKTSFLNHERAINVANDGGRWVMGTSGTPLPGEQSSWFSAPKVKDRFLEEHLAQLLLSMGLDAFNERFYRPEGILVERKGPTVPGFREYSLEEVQAQWREG